MTAEVSAVSLLPAGAASVGLSAAATHRAAFDAPSHRALIACGDSVRLVALPLFSSSSSLPIDEHATRVLRHASDLAQQRSATGVTVDDLWWGVRHRAALQAVAWQHGVVAAVDEFGNVSAKRDASAAAAAWFAAEDRANKQSFVRSGAAIAIMSAERVAVTHEAERSLAVVDLASGVRLRQWTGVGVVRCVASLEHERVAVADDDTLAIFDVRVAERTPVERVTLAVGDPILALDARGHALALGSRSRMVAVHDERAFHTPLHKANALTKTGVVGVHLSSVPIDGPAPALVVVSDEGELVAVEGALRTDALRADAPLLGFGSDGDGNVLALTERGTLLAVERWFAPAVAGVVPTTRSGRFKRDDQ